MAKKMKPGDDPDSAPKAGDNSSATDAEISEAMESVIALKAERTGHTAKAQACTKKINKVKTVLLGKGFPIKGFTRTLEDMETQRTEGGEDKRREIDEAHRRGREAVGLPGQLALFDQMAPQEDKLEPPPGGNGSLPQAHAQQ